LHFALHAVGVSTGAAANTGCDECADNSACCQDDTSYNCAAWNVSTPGVVGHLDHILLAAAHMHGARFVDGIVVKIGCCELALGSHDACWFEVTVRVPPACVCSNNVPLGCSLLSYRYHHAFCWNATGGTTRATPLQPTWRICWVDQCVC
jgi:hypothetical protein